MLAENIVTWENNVEKCEICLFLSYKIKFSFALVELFLKVKISININKEGKKKSGAFYTVGISPTNFCIVTSYVGKMASSPIY